MNVALQLLQALFEQPQENFRNWGSVDGLLTHTRHKMKHGGQAARSSEEL